MARRRSQLALALLTVGAMLSGSGISGAAQAAADCTATSPDWCTDGKTAQRTFHGATHGATTLTPTTIQTLVPAWYFRTGDAVSANPVVAKGVVYVGSWDGWFYAIDATSGVERWHYQLQPQPAVHPATSASPQENGRVPQYLDVLQSSPDALPDTVAGDVTSDGGLVTSSAFFVPANQFTHGDDLVIFGAGYTLYALRAKDGSEFFPPHDYPGTGCSEVVSTAPGTKNVVEVTPLAPCPAGNPPSTRRALNERGIQKFALRNSERPLLLSRRSRVV